MLVSSCLSVRALPTFGECDSVIIHRHRVADWTGILEVLGCDANSNISQHRCSGKRTPFLFQWCTEFPSPQVGRGCALIVSEAISCFGLAFLQKQQDNTSSFVN
eukprot:4564205-Amphidinium_carterae.1